jgi:Amt family ammonium transporter
VSGLVAVTPASGYIAPNAALLLGLVAGVGCYLGATALKRMHGYDDALDAFGIHGVGGIIGAIMTGFLADSTVGGVHGNVLTQLIGVGVTMVYSGVLTFILLVVVGTLVGLRVEESTEAEGLDIVEHGEAVA